MILVTGILAMAGMTSCKRSDAAAQESQVKRAFDSCKEALIERQTDQVMVYIPQNVDDYLGQLKANPKNSTAHLTANTWTDESPGVDLLLRTALEKKVPDDLRSKLTLKILMQRIADKRLLNPHDVEQITLGRISVNGGRASAELYYQGTLTALRLPFVREDKDWKIDIMSILPYAEVLMRLDRAIKGETENQQVEFLVSKLPSL